jgi:hypothetical protein
MRELGRNGIRRVRAHFTWQKVTRSVAGLYDDVAAANAAKGPLAAAAA